MGYTGRFFGGPSDADSVRLDFDSLDASPGKLVVPDAHLLFSGHFERTGSDLVISDQLHRVVVPHYFNGDKRPVLVSPEGAQLDSRVVDALTGHVAYAQAGGAAAGAKVVGHVVKMTGSASIVRNGVAIVVNTNDTLYQNDVIQTGSNSTLGLVLDDGSAFNLSANARFMCNDLVYEVNSTSNHSLTSLIQGAATFVAGQVAPTGDMEVSTPVAVIGVRGTAVILDINAVDGQVFISVADQQDGQVHSVQVFRCLPTNLQGVCTAGDPIGTVASNGASLRLTPGPNFQVTTQETTKSPAQTAQEFNSFQQVLSTYDAGKQQFPNLPQHTENTNQNNNTNTATTKTALGSAPAQPLELTSTSVFADTGTTKILSSGSIVPATLSIDSGVSASAVSSTTTSQTTTTAPLILFVNPIQPISIVSPGGTTNQANQLITGTVDPALVGTTVTLIDTYDGVSTQVGTTTVGAGGIFSATVKLAGDGTHSIVAQDSGSTSTTMVPVVFVLETMPPAVNINSAGGSVSQAAQTISGTVTAASGEAAVGNTVTLLDTVNGVTTQIGTATVGNGGSWSTDVTLSGNGTHSIIAQDTDAAGNTGRSTQVTFTVVTSAPAQPAAPSDSADINGFVNAANDTTGQALTGTAEAGSTVKIYLNGASTPAFTTTANAGGNWSQTVGHLADGSYSYTVTATDAAGNTSAASTALSFVVDTAAPQVTITSAGGPTNQATQTITGTVDLTDVGATVTVLDGATPIGSAVVQSNGNWTANNVTLTTPGSNSLTAQVTDAAGNTGTSNTVVYTLNTTVPVITSIATSGSGISNGNGDLNAGHVVTLTVSFSETVTVDTSLGTPTLVLNDGGTATYQTGTGSNALVFSYTIGSGENTADLTVNSLSLNGGTIQDASANNADLSGATNYNPAGTLQIDTAAPAQPAAPSDSADINGFVNAANDTTGQALTGTAEAGSTVKIYLNGASTPAFTTTANAGGNWSQTVGHLADGSYSYTVTATDAAGNTSAASTALSFVVDTAAPAQPAAPSDSADINGFVNAANDTTGQALTGTAEAGSTVKIYLNGASTPAFTTTANAGGNWSQTVGHLADGSYSYTVTATDAAGNTSAASTALSFVVDTAAPQVTITSAGGPTNQATQTITGTVDLTDVGATVTVLDGATPIGSAVVQSNGNWTANNVTLTTPGSNSLTAQVTDAAGNTGTSNTVVYTLNTTVPVITSIATSGSGISNGNGDLNAGHVVTLTVSFSETVTVDTSLGTPTLVLNDGGTATYQTGTGSNALVFSYTIGSGENTADLTVNSLSLNGGTIQDASANNADLSGATNYNPAGTLQIDTAAPAQPAAPSDSADINGFVNAANDTTGQALTGTAEAGSTVKIYLNGASTPAFTTTANAGGNWSQTVGHLADGSYSYTVTATDAAGNTSAASTALSFVVDTAAPAQPAAPSDSADINGFVNAANDTTGQALTGTAEAGSTVKIYLNGASTPAFTTTANAGGNWSQTVGHLADGSYSYTVTATDAAGNTSAASTALSFVVDTAAPQVTITSAGGPTNQATQTITGTVDLTDVGATVTVLDGATPIGSAVVQSNGNWTANNVTLTTPGSNSLTAQVTDAAGNTGTSNTVVYTLNTTVPVITSIATSGSGISNGNGDLNAGHVVTLTVSFSETVTVDTSLGTPTLVLNDGGTATYQTGTGSNALVFSYTIGSGENTADLTVNSLSLNGGTIQDASANNADLSGATNYNPAGTLQIDTAAPAQPAAPSDSADINGFVNAANDTTGQALTGTAEAGSTVKIYLNGASTPAFTTTANAGGNWSQTVGHLADGSYSYTVTATDAAGNTSAASTALSFVVDTAAPAQPAAPSDSADINGFVNAANDTTGQALTGTAEAGSTVKIYLNGASTPAFTTTANAGGNWSQTVGHLADGSYSYTVTATDAAGNTSAASTALSFVVDTAAPAQPAAPSDSADINGFVNAANDTTGQALTGTAEAGSTVKIYLNGASTPAFTTTANAGGNWSQTVGHLADGSYSYTVTATDAAGNTSAASTALSFVVDTAAPQVTITSAGGPTNQATQTITGTVDLTDVGATVTVLDGATPIGSAVVQSNGNWTANNVTLTTPGSNSLTAQVTDAAGNTGTSNTVVYTLNTTVPVITSIATSGSGISNGNGDLNAGHVVTLTVSFSETVTVDTSLGTPTLVLNDGGTATYQTGTGSNALVFSYTIGSGENTADLTVNSLSLNGGTIQDASANNADLSGATNYNPAGTLQIDTAAPAQPAAPSDSADINGFVNAANDTTGQALTGTAEAGSTVKIYLNGASTPAFTTTANAGGNWSQTVGHLADGSYSYTVTATDAAGNTSAASTALSFVVDTAAPAQPAAPSDSADINGFVNAANDTTGQALTGTAEAGSTVKIYLNGASTPAFTTTANAGGNWSQTVGHLADGSYSYTVTATDAAGNTSAASTALSFVVDTARRRQ